MSHSAFRILTNDEPIERNLVIVVNKNGQVATDTEALQNLLTSKGDADTGISILRETSPTPSITKEIDQERSERYEMRRQEYLSAHAGEEIDEEELENQIRLITGSIEDEIPHVTLNVENFYTSDQARKFANDVLHLGGIDNPASLMPIDINFRRQTIQNDHCYTPLTQSPERPEKPTPKSKNAQNKSLKSEQKPTPKSRQQFEEESSDSGEAALDDDEEYEEEQSGEEEDVSFSESDDDNDIDFSVNDRFGKKGKKKRKYRKHSKQKNMTFKDFLETGDVSQVDNEPKKKYNKSPKKAAVSRPSTSGKINTSSTSKNTQQNVIVKKIVQQPLPTVKNNTIRKESTAQFVPLNASFMRTQPMGQISVHTSQLRTLSGPITIQSQPMKSQQEFVESLVKDLETSFPENNKSLPNTIPNIMQMMETSTPVEVFDQTLDQLDAADGAVPGIEEINDVLAVLGNDAIDELLNQNDLINFDTSAPILKLTQGLLSSTMAHSHPILATSEATSSISTQMPKILNKQAPAKDQIKVVRNGRVITLPPIEAPATRGAKRRAQGDSPNTSISSPTTGKVAKTERTPSSKDPESANSSRRSSFAKSESGKSSRRQSFAQSAVAADEEMDDLESVEEGASEDDPDRLWCICRQPHNNRFMICCDKCEEWFHGKCVNVTKAMGAEFEQKKKEWRCPNCRAEGPGVAKKVDFKKKPLNQQKLTAFFAKSQKESTDEDVAKTVCVVCKEKPARDSSIYCSDECIQNHATKHLDDSSPKTPVSSKTSETGKRGNVLKDKSGNVIVYDKTTGIILPLSKSPHFTTLGQWLSRNPNFEPVKPGSAQAEQLLSRNRAQSQPQTPTSTTSPVKTIIQTATGEDLFSNPVKIHTGVTTTPVAAKKPPGQGQHSGNSVRTNVSMKNTSSLGGVKAAQKSPSVTSTSAKTLPSKPETKRPVKSQQSEGRSLVDRERAKIRNIFKETLQTRMKDFDHPSIPKMTEEEIDSFVKETEKEMFYYFNKDIREKYKAKYRSLKFNLGDVKNKTILERVCAKKLTPKQLVELPPAALASEELAKWREDENKHQLEIITKSELDALAQTKIVVKTHKGEEIIEQKSVSTDISVPTIDDVESVIAKSVLSVDDPHGRYDLSRSISVNNSTNSPLVSPGSTSTSVRKPDSRHRSRSRSKSRGRDHHHHHKSSSKHKKSERHRSRSPRHHKDGKSRERSKSKKSDDHKHYREKSKSREKDKTSGSSSRSRDQRHDKPKDMKKKEEVKPVGTLDIQPDQQDVDLVGKILDSMGVHLDKPLVPKEEKPKEEEVKAVIKEATPPVQTKKLVEIYSGKIYMAEITDFDVTASIVSGSFDDIVKVLPSQLDAVGRIEPSTVVDYLDKVKRLPGKELCILRFSPTEDSKTSYDEFFNYLHSRQRYGVIKLTSPRVKDFYLVPVKAGQPLPKVLLPISSPGFVEGEEHRPDLLVGVLLKVAPEDRTKKQSINMKKMQSKSRPLPDNKTLQSKHKSQTSKLTMGLPEFSKTGELQTSSSKKSPTDTNDDGDEPYTPFDDDELMIQSNYKPSSSSVAVSKQASDDLESQMEKINREIEQRQMEIQSLAKRKLDDIDEEQASRIFENISVPHNLSEMLSTISKNQASEMKAIEIDDNDDDDEYVPIPMTSSMDYRSSVTHPSYSAVNQQQTPIVNSMMDIDERIAMFQSPPSVAINVDDQPSRLASMTAADLMKLVPDGAFEPPSPPIISEPNQPSIPGLGNDDYEME